MYNRINRLVMKKKIKVEVVKLDPRAVLPEFGTDDSAGADIRIIEDYKVKAGETKLLKTGLSIKVPKGYELEIRPRSGMSLRTKIRLSNSPGTIDSDYRGEIGIIVDNIGTMDFAFEKGQRVAQGILKEVPKVEYVEVDSLDDTSRGSGGFGSTGK